MKKVFRILLAVCLAVMLTFACTACGSKDGDNSDANDNDNNNNTTTVTVRFSESSIDMSTGKTRDISVTVTGSDEAVTFSSSEKRTISVEPTGKTTATLEALKDGDATITAAIGDVSATLAVSAKTRGIKVVGNKVLSVAPGDTHEFDVELKNISGTITVDSNVTGVTAKVKEGTATETGATIEFTGANNVELGKTAILTVKAGDADTAEVQVDTYSKGLLLGDGNYQTNYLAVDSDGVVARGVGSDFVNGALVIPRYIYYTPAQHIDVYRNNEYKDEANQDSFWAPVVNIGVRTGDHNNEGVAGYQPGKGDKHMDENEELIGCHHDIYKLANDDPFYIESGKTITSLNTGDSVTAINESAFEGVGSITKVHIGKAMTHVCDKAFENESNMQYEDAFTKDAVYTYNGTVEELTFSPECKIGTIGVEAFCSNKLTKLILPDTVAVIASSAFQWCGTEILKLPLAWQKIYSQPAILAFGNVFFDLVYLKEIYIPWQICFAMSDDKLTNSSNADAKAAADALAEELGITDYERGGNYYNLMLSNVKNFCMNGTKDALKNPNITATDKVKVYYLGPKVLMDNVLSIQNHIALGDWSYNESENKYINQWSYENGYVGIHDATTGRQMSEYHSGTDSNYADPLAPNFRDTFFDYVSYTHEYGPAHKYVYGNDKVEWDFTKTTCPYNVDGTNA